MKTLGHAYTYTRMCMHAPDLRAHATCTCTHTRACMCKLGFQKPYMISFQNTQKILRENIRFTKNSESKREFFTKYLQVNIFLIDAFSGIDLRVSNLLITSLFNCE